MNTPKAYRLYFMGHGPARASDVIYAHDDDAAIQQAQGRAIADDIEVRQDGEFIALVKAKQSFSQN